MSNAVKLSICIATYNRGKLISQTLDSILSQMQPGVELIVVDGASPDDTPKVMEQYLARHSEIHYYREKQNSGVDCDYDKAVRYATGEYCWLMTDDDLLCCEAISRVLAFLNGTVDLVVVNAQVRNANLSKQLNAHILNFGKDRLYDAGAKNKFFAEVASYLSFIGCVVIKRSLWIARDRASYFGTLFVHVGVIFQNPPIGQIQVIAEPLIIIRWGNAMWTARGFEIWMVKWPKLIWSFDDISAEAKLIVSPLQPLKMAKQLVFFRANGGYSIIEYRSFPLDRVTGMPRMLAFIIAIVPASLLNCLATLYAVIAIRGARARVYDLARSRHTTWISRVAARILNVDI